MVSFTFCWRKDTSIQDKAWVASPARRGLAMTDLFYKHAHLTLNGFPSKRKIMSCLKIKPSTTHVILQDAQGQVWRQGKVPTQQLLDSPSEYVRALTRFGKSQTITCNTQAEYGIRAALIFGDQKALDPLQPVEVAYGCYTLSIPLSEMPPPHASMGNGRWNNTPFYGYRQYTPTPEMPYEFLVSFFSLLYRNADVKPTTRWSNQSVSWSFASPAYFQALQVPAEETVPYAHSVIRGQRGQGASLATVSGLLEPFNPFQVTQHPSMAFHALLDVIRTSSDGIDYHLVGQCLSEMAVEPALKAWCLNITSSFTGPLRWRSQAYADDATWSLSTITTYRTDPKHAVIQFVGEEQQSYPIKATISDQMAKHIFGDRSCFGDPHIAISPEEAPGLVLFTDCLVSDCVQETWLDPSTWHERKAYLQDMDALIGMIHLTHALKIHADLYEPFLDKMMARFQDPHPERPQWLIAWFERVATLEAKSYILMKLCRKIAVEAIQQWSVEQREVIANTLSIPALVVFLRSLKAVDGAEERTVMFCHQVLDTMQKRKPSREEMAGVAMAFPWQHAWTGHVRLLMDTMMCMVSLGWHAAEMTHVVLGMLQQMPYGTPASDPDSWLECGVRPVNLNGSLFPQTPTDLKWGMMSKSTGTPSTWLVVWGKNTQGTLTIEPNTDAAGASSLPTLCYPMAFNAYNYPYLFEVPWDLQRHTKKFTWEAKS